ncbi:MAG: STE24 endopeptidase [Marivirga sp.]|jgi:STE24 endopeptidase
MQFNATEYLAILLIIIGGEYLFSTFVDLLNSRNDSSHVPEKLNSYYDDDKYQIALAYQKENARFGLLNGFVSLLTVVCVIFYGLLGKLDAYFTAELSGMIPQTLAFFGVIFLVNDVMNMPFQLYSTFRIEEKYGFNNTTVKVFFLDKLKGYLFTALIGSILLSVLILLITYLSASFWWIFWIVISIFMIGANFLYTSWIVPIFNKLTPLEDGELKSAIVAYGESVNFPVENIFVIDGSKRSNKANAYFSGFGRRKKIVLFDTLVKNYTTEELVAILAHEVGHYKLKHTIFGMVNAVIQVGFMLFVMSLMIFEPSLSEALGAMSLSFGINLIAFGIIFTPISMLTGIIGNYLSRKHEFEADAFAKKTYNGAFLATALKKLSVDNLSNLWPHKFYVFIHYSHPPLLKRLLAIERSE